MQLKFVDAMGREVIPTMVTDRLPLPGETVTDSRDGFKRYVVSGKIDNELVSRIRGGSGLLVVVTLEPEGANKTRGPLNG